MRQVDHSPLPGGGRFRDRNFLDEVTHARAFGSPQCGFSVSIFGNNPCTGLAPVSAPKHNRLWWTHMHAMLAPLRSPAGSKRLVHLACAIGNFSWLGSHVRRVRRRSCGHRCARDRSAPVPKRSIQHKVDASKLYYANGKCLIRNGVPFVLRPLFYYSPHANHRVTLLSGARDLARWLLGAGQRTRSL